VLEFLAARHERGGVRDVDRERLDEVPHPLHGDARAVDRGLVVRGGCRLELLVQLSGLLAEQAGGGRAERSLAGTAVVPGAVEGASHASLEAAELRRHVLADARVGPVAPLDQASPQPGKAAAGPAAERGGVVADPGELYFGVAAGA